MGNKTGEDSIQRGNGRQEMETQALGDSAFHPPPFILVPITMAYLLHVFGPLSLVWVVRTHSRACALAGPHPSWVQRS